MDRKTNLKMLVLIWVVVVAITGAVLNVSTVYGQAQPDYPSDGAVISGDIALENIWTKLTFFPDASAVKHKGYFSQDYSEVAGRVQDANLGEPPYGHITGWEYTYFAGNPQVPPAVETLVRGAKYYWTVDETDALGNTLAGDVWEFIIQGFKASFPNPHNEAIFVETDVLLSWIPGFDVEEHDVYLGTDLASIELAEYDSSFPPPEYIGTTEEPNIFATGLASDTEYYWRIDEVSGRLPYPFDGGTYHKSDVWGFTTVPEGLGSIREDLWWNIAGDAVSDLLNDPRYPGNPDETRMLTSFNSGVALGNDYGGQIHGWLHPVKSGNYTFWLCSDDSSELFLSTDHTPANKVRIAYINGWANPFDWYNQSGTHNPNQQSAPIPLVGGRKYYIMARWKEDYAGDHCMVAWQGPDQPQAPVYGSSFAVIKGNRLSPYAQLWAHDPEPSDGQVNVVSPVTLRWGPGDYATEHDVYISTDKALVESRAPSVYKGRIDSNFYYLGRVFSGMIYYWAIDEVSNLGPSPGIWQGDVWSFTTKPAPIFVDDDAIGANDGSSWADAYNSLQDGLARADSSVKPVEIRVAQGIYKPAPPYPPGAPPLPFDRTATFQLINGVTINGGYAGLGEADPNARDIDVYETILSGDLADNDIEVSDPCDLLDELSRGENSYHVVTGSETDSTAVLDGFTITAGNAKGSGNGGGIYCHSGFPTLTNCTFIRNSAEFFGGAIYYHGSSNATLINCTFNENSAMSGGGICDGTSSLILKQCLFSRNWAHSGGGMSSIIWSMSKLIQCTFSGNSAYRGGGISTDESSPMITNCIFSGNSAHRGGVMENSGGSVTLTNCIFSGNSAIIEGGAIYNQGGYVTPLYIVEGGNLTLTNCTFAGNSAVDGNAIACDSMTQFFPSELQVTNCIFWDGGNEIWNNDGSTITMTYSDVWGGWHGTGNIEADPCFIAHGHWEPPPPLFNASEPNPADGAMGVSITSDLNWTAGHDAISHDVYFGTSSVPPFTGNQTSTTFDPGSMAYGTTYYWRIDEVNDSSTTTGDTWIFTTMIAPPPPPPPPPMLTLSASNMGDNQQYIWIYGDYHLLGDSPCIDAGDPCYVSGPNETDLDGRPRVIGGRIDMGAYEFFNTPPVADAGDDQNVECACNTDEGTKVTLDGSGSYDVDGDALTYRWTGPFAESPADGATPTVTLEDGCPGEYVITLVVNDGTEDSEPNEVVITVMDTTPPEFTFSVTPTILWPPNKKMVMITPSWTLSDNCDSTPDVSLVSISMNESEATGNMHNGDDIQISKDGTIYVRAKRNRTGDRIYTITYQAVDDSGNAAVRSATVTVPRKRR